MARFFTQFDDGLAGFQQTSGGAAAVAVDTSVYETGSRSIRFASGNPTPVAGFLAAFPHLTEADLPISVFFAMRISSVAFQDWVLALSFRASESDPTRFGGGIRGVSGGNGAPVSFAQVGTRDSNNGPSIAASGSASQSVWIYILGEVVNTSRYRVKAWIGSAAEPSGFGADCIGESQAGFNMAPRLVLQSNSSKTAHFDRVGIGTQGDAAPRTLDDMSRIFAEHEGQTKRVKRGFVMQNGVLVPIKKGWIGTSTGNKPLIG